MAHRAGSLAFDISELSPGRFCLRGLFWRLPSLQSWGPNVTPRDQSPGSLQPLSQACPRLPGAVSSQGSRVCRTRTFQAHAHRQTLLEAAEGTALTLRLVDFAALTLGARVMLVVLDCALEEALCERKGVNARSRPSVAVRTPATCSLTLPC